ncbi:hypothetical protein HYALB_00010185 [Hymenoscyphus albidus]|uniref:Sin3 binding protein n=1 Tax=Hymenoscyphus albidus TaxID=595503 RepID=A0A9N9LDG3_9HELO|nr:hypothetical protein HYALB_00010185 [Hymenoscyphus albidus]
MPAMATSARGISKASVRDSFTAVAAMSVPATKAQPLPTPPNSISPNILPHDKPYGTRSAAKLALDPVESDLDLRDGQTGSEDAFPEKSRKQGSPGFDTAGAITPALLARHHLPEILLSHGPLAIRHIMGYLTTSVPGFSGIPPAKARRLVVGALEGKGSAGDGGGLKGEVKFEKVGWGRWDARLKGHARSRSSQHSPPPSGSSSYSTGMPIAKNHQWRDDRGRLNVPGSSWAGDSAVFSHDDEMDHNMVEDEADKMSLDDEDSCSSSEAEPEDEVMGGDDDPDDITDDEDWAAVGAAALRAASYSASGPGNNYLTTLYPGGPHSGGGPSLNTLAKSAPLRPSQLNNIDLSAYGMASDSQEREAIEALLRLGSV